MRYLLIFCIMLFSGCKDEYDDIKVVKAKISECEQIKKDIDVTEKLYYDMIKELKLQYYKEVVEIGEARFIKSPTADYLMRIGSLYVNGLKKQFTEKDCYTYL